MKNWIGNHEFIMTFHGIFNLWESLIGLLNRQEVFSVFKLRLSFY